MRNSAYALEIHDTQAGGSNRRRILAPPAGTVARNVNGYEWAPDSSRLAFWADTVDGSQVFTAIPDGTNVTQVSLPLGPGSRTGDFHWSPDSSRLAYLARTQDVYELYSVAPDGTGTVKLNAPLTAGMEVNYEIAWAPNGSRIAYAIHGLNFQDMPPELYTVRPDGSDRIRLNPPTANNIIDLFKWSSDSSRLAYRLGSQFSDRKLFIVGADGSDHFEVNGMLAADPIPQGKGEGSPLRQHFDWSPDSTHLFHVAESGTAASPAELFTLRADTRDYAKLNDPLPGSVSLEFTRFMWSKDGSRAAYLADDDGDGTNDLFLVAPNGAAYRTFPNRLASQACSSSCGRPERRYPVL